MIRLLLAVLFLAASSAQARTWNILVDGSGDAPTVQAGIDSSAVGDTVLVHLGTYFEHIDFLGKDIVVKSQAGPEMTILDGGMSPSSVVKFESGESNAAVIEGFTIQNGEGVKVPGPVGPDGGGIFIRESSATILNNILQDNEAPLTTERGWGGAIFAEGVDVISTPVIRGNQFLRNTAAGNGGAIAIRNSCRALIEDNYFFDNRALDGDGGAIWLSIRIGGTVVVGNTVRQNGSGDKSGGIHCAGIVPGLQQVTIIQNLIIGNACSAQANFQKGGCSIWLGGVDATISWNTIAAGGAISDKDGAGFALIAPVRARITNNVMAEHEGHVFVCEGVPDATITNNLFWQSAPFASDIIVGDGCEGLLDISQNLFEDPLFCSYDNWGFPDYAPAANSPIFTDPLGPMGAVLVPGCEVTPVETTTWGGLKLRYRD